MMSCVHIYVSLHTRDGCKQNQRGFDGIVLLTDIRPPNNCVPMLGHHLQPWPSIDTQLVQPLLLPTRTLPVAMKHKLKV